MSVLSQLATAMARKDEYPNIDLANRIVDQNDKKSALELAENLNNKSKNIQHDCIKVLYEIGERKPELIFDYLNTFLKLLSSKNNRMQWGAMTALHSLVVQYPEAIFKNLGQIIKAADQGSVITRDYAVFILLKLCNQGKYKESAFALFLDQILICPTNQLPMYAERALPILQNKMITPFDHALRQRMDEMEPGPKQKRLELVLRKAKVL